MANFETVVDASERIRPFIHKSVFLFQFL